MSPADAAPLFRRDLDLPAKPGGWVLAMGMFDGVHRGHQAVLAAARAQADALGAGLATLSFHPHPSRVLRPERATELLLPPAAKARRLRAHGVDEPVLWPFTRDFAELPAEAFPAWLRTRLPALRAIHVGENFRYGHRRLGDAALLVHTGAAAALEVVAATRALDGGEPVSSTRIRAAVKAADFATAERLLGDPYCAEGAVIPGRRLGRTLGFPTLNLPWAPECRPPHGVYAGELHGGEGTGAWTRPAVANFGLRPTVETAAPEPLLEVHALEPLPPGTSEGAFLRFAWRTFLRPERRFASLDDLREQIAVDAAEAREYHRDAETQRSA